MIIRSKKAKDFLFKNGEVYIFRSKQRNSIGKDWITDKRGGNKLSNMQIKEIGFVSVYLLGDYVNLSGFKILPEWHKEIRKLNKGMLNPFGWLYKVTLTKTE
jgi:hypothetical protein